MRYEPQVKAGTSTWAQVAKRFAQRGPGRVELKIWRITEVERYLFLYWAVGSSVSLGWMGAPLVQVTVLSELESGQ